MRGEGSIPTLASNLKFLEEQKLRRKWRATVYSGVYGNTRMTQAAY